MCNEVGYGDSSKLKEKSGQMLALTGNSAPVTKKQKRDQNIRYAATPFMDIAIDPSRAFSHVTPSTKGKGGRDANRHQHGHDKCDVMLVSSSGSNDHSRVGQCNLLQSSSSREGTLVAALKDLFQTLASL